MRRLHCRASAPETQSLERYNRTLQELQEKARSEKVGSWGPRYCNMNVDAPGKEVGEDWCQKDVGEDWHQKDDATEQDSTWHSSVWRDSSWGSSTWQSPQESPQLALSLGATRRPAWHRNERAARLSVRGGGFLHGCLRARCCTQSTDTVWHW